MPKVRRARACIAPRFSEVDCYGSVGGGLMLALNLPTHALISDELASGAAFAPNAFLRIDRSGTVTFIMPYVEMGQGTYTSIPMLIAEELEVDVDKVVIEHAPPNEKLYINPLFGLQGTGGSTSIRASWEPMRRAGATARTMLVAAAANQWKVASEACRAENGAVVHAASGRRLGYGALADAAATLQVPEKVALKAPADFKLIGTPHKRLDTAGQARRQRKVRHRRATAGHEVRGDRDIAHVRRQARIRR